MASAEAKACQAKPIELNRSTVDDANRLVIVDDRQ
jgi:hypothetical protein